MYQEYTSQYEITCHWQRGSLFPSVFLKVLLQEKLIAKKVLNNGNYRELAFKGRWMINEDKCWQMGRMKSSHKRFTGSRARKQQLSYIITWNFFSTIVQNKAIADPSPIIALTCHWITHWLTYSHLHTWMVRLWLIVSK